MKSVPGYRKETFTLTLLFLFALTLNGCKAPLAKNRPLQQWGYLVPASFQAENFAQIVSVYDTLCIGVYRLNAEGKIYSNPGLSRKQRSILKNWQRSADNTDSEHSSRNPRLLPLVSLRNAGEGATMLRSQKSRERAVSEVADLIQREGFDGVHIDFEYLHERSAYDFVAFLSELRARPEMRQRVISIAAFPPLHGKPQEIAFFDMDRLSDHIDEVVYMTYDYHLIHAGPVTDLSWARKNIELALTKIDREKVWLGVPAYGYSWPVRDGTPGAKGKSANTGKPVVIHEKKGKEQCQRYGCFRDDSGMLRVDRQDRIVYFSDSVLRKEMLELARDLGLRGVAFWRVGFESGSMLQGKSPILR